MTHAPRAAAGMRHLQKSRQVGARLPRQGRLEAAIKGAVPASSRRPPASIHVSKSGSSRRDGIESTRPFAARTRRARGMAQRSAPYLMWFADIVAQWRWMTDSCVRPRRSETGRQCALRALAAACTPLVSRARNALLLSLDGEKNSFPDAVVSAEKKREGEKRRPAPRRRSRVGG